MAYCLIDYRTSESWDNFVYLWKPSIRKFKKLPVPDGNGSFGKGERLTVPFKGKLALTMLGKQPYGMPICIWVMREYGVHESSNKLCIVSVENTVSAAPNKIWTRFTGYTKYASLLIQEQSHEKKMKSCWKKEVCIN